MIYTYKEALKKYRNQYGLKKAIEKGEIFQQKKGIYSDDKYVPELSIIATQYPKGIFTLNSAFYYYNLTDVIPEKHYLATDRDASKIQDSNVFQIFERKDILELGTTTIQKNGIEIRIYNKERLLVELLRHSNKLPFDYYKEVLLNFREIIYDLDIAAIQDYAYEIPKSSMIMKKLQLEVL